VETEIAVMESVHGKDTAVQNGAGVVQLPNTVRAPRGLLHLLDSIPLLLHPWMQASAVPVILVKDCVLILHTAVANGDIVVPGKDTATLSMMVQMKRESVAEEVLGTEFAVVDIVALSMDTVVKVLITARVMLIKEKSHQMKK
jgi:hypothetical protein